MEEKDVFTSTFVIGDPYSAGQYAKNGAGVMPLPDRQLNDGPYSDLLGEEQFEIRLPDGDEEGRKEFWRKMNS